MSGLSFLAKGRNGTFAIDAAFKSDSGITALFGQSGAGKSTILKMIAGTLTPETGRISIGDFVLFDFDKDLNLPSEKRRIGYVFQDARLFPHLSVKRNLTYAQWAGGRRSQRDFDEVIQLLGIESLLSRNPATLSGGERQRVAIGRALLSDPALLLLDEPLSSLDNARRLEILPFIEHLRDESQVPIVYVSHEIEEVARLADNIVLIDNGKILAAGKAGDVFPLISREGDETGVLLEGRVLAYDNTYKLADIDLGGAVFQLADLQLTSGMSVRLRIRARDVSLAQTAPVSVSIRNILPVTITDIQWDGSAHVEAVLDFNGRKIISRITRKSCDDLGLIAGDSVFALVKAVSIDRAAIREI